MSKEMKKKFKNGGFWLSLASAIILSVQANLAIFGIDMPVNLDEKIMFGIASLVFIGVILGIVSSPKEGRFWKDDKPAK